LATMHMSWGWGFLTSPRSLAKKVIASRRPAVNLGAGAH
ncbi:glycosyltransferase family 2 protein, partial [Streptomyces althioticus]